MYTSHAQPSTFFKKNRKLSPILNYPYGVGLERVTSYQFLLKYSSHALPQWKTFSLKNAALMIP